jgi:hypothetical protein
MRYCARAVVTPSACAAQKGRASRKRKGSGGRAEGKAAVTRAPPQERGAGSLLLDAIDAVGLLAVTAAAGCARV